MAWQLLVGDIPEGMFVLHKCNVPRCINPDHLYLGSRADNWADFKATGRNIIRNTSGEHNGRVKLTEANVLEIRRRRQAGENWKVLAKEYGVSHKTIWKVSTKNSWRHI